MEDNPKFQVVERVTLKKFDGDWTNEQIEAGEADDALVEMVTYEGDVVIECWKKNGTH